MLPLLAATALAEPPPDDDDVLEVVVRRQSDAEALRRSAEAVTVIETDAAQQQSADLGEVMARTQGVSVRRTGGLGSDAQVSLAGLTGDQVRFFLDGVPLALAGYPLGLATVPVGAVQRVEVYRGVVPVRFGADALGGAIHLVSERSGQGVGGSVSYQGGSFDTHRLAARVESRARGGLAVVAEATLDHSANDYLVDVEVPNEVGQLEPATVRRFHDAYTAAAGAVEVGAMDRRWAERASVRVFGAHLARDIPHNVVMTVPYGAAAYTTDTAGVLARYEQPVAPEWRVDAYAGFTWRDTHLTDLGSCVVDWFGRCVRERLVAGEITTPGTDRRVGDETAHGRLRVAWRPSDAHAVELAITPLGFSRSGEDLLNDGTTRDPLTARRDLVQVVSGAEHVLTVGPLENRGFVKHYAQWLRSEEPIPGGDLGIPVDRSTQRLGAGDGLRIAVADRVWLKASYEWATRLPSPEEVFGNGVRIVDSLELAPETSHNVNLGANVQLAHPDAGALTVDVQGFGRFARDLIVLLGNDARFSYQNVFGARSVGVEASAAWSTPGGWLGFDANTTWLDLRNTSDEGTFGAYAGDRIPNRPWWMANGAVHLARHDLATDGDRLGLDVHSRWVHGFFRGWESVGAVQFKQEVPAQLSHTVALTYAVRADPDHGERVLHGSIEVDNLTDARLYDDFGVQRPGRAVYGKLGARW
ncbi:MAG: TonB-dependent receptor [Myxococcota bacterium]